jgi:hypothetical protein
VSEKAPEYLIARRVLLDALTALDVHVDNLILVGAQAVYHHAGEADLDVPPFTTDGDLAINTRGLAGVPEIGLVLRTAGFRPGPNPGHWVSSGDVAVDLMVVPHQSGTTSASARSARIAPHEKLTARVARGLEPALVDNKHVTIAAIEPGDARTFEIRVAGPAALLTAKAIKISERLEQADIRPDRLKEKDALDAFRILQAIDTSELVRGFELHREDEHAAAVTAEAIEVYRRHASTPQSRIALLAASGAQGDPTIAPAFAALVVELLAVI